MAHFRLIVKNVGWLPGVNYPGRLIERASQGRPEDTIMKNQQKTTETLIRTLAIGMVLVIQSVCALANGSGYISFVSDMRSAGLNGSDIQQITKELNVGHTKSSDALVDLGGCGELDFSIRPVSLNMQNFAGIVINLGNSCTSGVIGTTAHLYIKANNKLIKSFSIVGADVTPIYNDEKSPPIFRIEGPGYCHPVYAWNHANYAYSCSEQEQQGGCVHEPNVKLCGDADISM